jgi:O-succinylbenzoate synthase
MLPPLSDLLDRLHVVALPMRVRFRGITVREVALIDGPFGWGEFGAFLEYPASEAAHWLASAIESAYTAGPSGLRERIPVNATVPAVTPEQVPGVLARFPNGQGQGGRARADAGRRHRPGKRRPRGDADRPGGRQRRVDRG